jgi:anti-sigma factor RsiW
MAGDHIEWEKLDRYVLGEGSADERAALERWVNDDPARRSLVEAMRTVGTGPTASRRQPEWNTARAFGRVQRQLGIASPAVPPKIVVVRRSRIRRAFARVVVVTGAAAAVVLGVLWRNLSTSRPVDVAPREWATAWTR